MKWLDLLDSVNVIGRVEAVIGGVLHSRPRGLHGTPRPGSPVGMREMRLTREGSISGADACKHLAERGVKTWGGRTTSDWFVWYVNAAQYEWAEEVLRRMEAGDPVPAWSENERRPQARRTEIRRPQVRRLRDAQGRE